MARFPHEVEKREWCALLSVHRVRVPQAADKLEDRLPHVIPVSGARLLHLGGQVRRLRCGGVPAWAHIRFTQWFASRAATISDWCRANARKRTRSSAETSSNTHEGWPTNSHMPAGAYRSQRADDDSVRLALAGAGVLHDLRLPVRPGRRTRARAADPDHSQAVSQLRTLPHGDRATAAAWSAPGSARSKAATRSHAHWPISPAKHPAT